MGDAMTEMPAEQHSEPPDLCGTYAGYQRHRRVKETPCQPCRDASAAYVREWRSQPDHRAKAWIDRSARRVAHQGLAKLYPADYRRLFTAERDRLLAATSSGGTDG